MTRTITADSGPFFLSSANPGDSPLTLATGITLSGANYGIVGDDSQAWVVVNQGSVLGGTGTGIYFGAGGSITNSGTASFIGGHTGVQITRVAGTVGNEGTISATSDGVVWFDGGVLTNSGTLSRIEGGQYGAYVSGGTGSTVTNEGSITGGAGQGVKMRSGGTVANNGTAASISAASVGVYFGTAGGAGSVANAGSITGGFAGVMFETSGALDNSGTASGIFGGAYGIYAPRGAVTVTNAGTITASTNRGVVLSAGGSVTNSGTGALISGAIYGVQFRNDAGTIGNQGTITGGSQAVEFAAVDGNVFRTFPGAVTNGAVYGGGQADTLALGSGFAGATIAGIGSHYIGFSVFSEDPGASWVLDSSDTLGSAPSLHLDGVLDVETTLSMSALTLSGSGALFLVSGGAIEVGSAGDATGGLLVIDAGSTLATGGSVTVTDVLNQGTIAVAAGGDGVFSADGGVVTNSGTGALISGGDAGVFLQQAGTVTNAGTIAGASNGVRLGAGGALYNSGTAAAIMGGLYGAYVQAISFGAVVSNEGTISSTSASGIGVDLDNGGTLNNIGAASFVYGNSAGVTAFSGGGPLRVGNEGTITGGVGVIGGTLSVTNSGTGALISGASYGVIGNAVNAAATVINQGTISGGNGAVRFFGSLGNTLVMYPGAVLGGAVTGRGSDTLVLASGASTGTIAGIGSQYYGFSVLDENGGANWVMAGANSFTASAAISVTAGATLEVAGTLLAEAVLTLDGIGTLAVDGTAAVEVGGTTGAVAGQLVVDQDGTLVYDHFVSLATVSNQGSILGQYHSGVYLGGGGIVTNSGTGAVISGPIYGIFAAGSTPSTVFNQGSITGTANLGVFLGAGGSVSNSGASALIEGAGQAIRTGGTGTVFNQGLISATGSTGIGVHLDGGTVDNAGTIAGTADAVQFGAGQNDLLKVEPLAVFSGIVDGGNTAGGIASSTLELAAGAFAGTLSGLGSQYIHFQAITVDSGAIWTIASGNSLGETLVANQGTLSGPTNGVYLRAGGTIINSGGATISGGQYGVYVFGAASLSNQGSIGGVDAVYFGGGGTVTNSATGASIRGSQNGIVVRVGSGSVDNQGTISGGARVGVSLNAGGTVTNSGASAQIAGGIYGVEAFESTVISNEGTISGAAGYGVYLVRGGTVTNAGRISGAGRSVYFGSGYANRVIVDPGAVFAGAVDGGNTIGATSSSVLELASGATAGTLSGVGAQYIGFQTIDVDTGAGWLIAGDTAGLASGQAIGGFTFGDTIELTGFVENGFSFGGGGLVLDSAGGPETIGLQGVFTNNSFGVSNDGSNSFVEVVACFAAGTRLRTPRGEVAVETLAVGETVRTASGGEAPVVWIGQRTVDCARHPQPERVWPVRIRAGAFGPGQPCRDLLLSPDHAVHVDGVLIPIKLLINATSIAQLRMDRVTYCHVELPRHDVVLADGLPTESYLDTGNRANFANTAGSVTLHPDFAQRLWDAEACAPLVVTGAKLDAVRRRVNARADAQPRNDGLSITAA